MKLSRRSAHPILSLALLVALVVGGCSANVLAAEPASNDLVAVRYYLSKHDYTAAIGRLKATITQHRASPLADEAFARLAQAYLALISEPLSVEDPHRQFLASEAQTAVAVLIRQFPTSHFSAQALDGLKAAGLDPVENPSHGSVELRNK
jgi:outer membrane protein assembly factor BamD (BamD/ComL family)